MALVRGITKVIVSQHGIIFAARKKISRRFTFILRTLLSIVSVIIQLREPATLAVSIS